MEIAAVRQPADNRHLSGHDDDGVGVVPEDIGIAGYDDGSQNTPAKAEELQYQRGEDAAEEKINIEEDREPEIVASQTGGD